MGQTSKEQLYEFVDKLREHLGISFDSYPIDTISICENNTKADIMYHEFKFDGFCAMVLFGHKKDTFVLNTKRQPEELNFDCGHELIHSTKHRNCAQPFYKCINGVQDSFQEWEANEGSAELLIPYRLLLPMVKEAYPSFTESYLIRWFIKDVAHKFYVTEAIAELRLKNLRYEIQQYLSGVPINGIEFLSNRQLMLAGIDIQSLDELENEMFWNEYKIHIRSKK